MKIPGHKLVMYFWFPHRKDEISQGKLTLVAPQDKIAVAKDIVRLMYTGNMSISTLELPDALEVCDIWKVLFFSKFLFFS